MEYYSGLSIYCGSGKGSYDSCSRAALQKTTESRFQVCLGVLYLRHAFSLQKFFVNFRSR